MAVGNVPERSKCGTSARGADITLGVIYRFGGLAWSGILLSAWEQSVDLHLCIWRHLLDQSGTTAHVGISLYGSDGRSGHRHLDGRNAFVRNSMDIFHIATDHSLGNIWKIQIWHDNKGLSPSWFPQYVIVKDLQSGKKNFFLINDWLSVDNDDNGGLVEKEILAASKSWPTPLLV
ncbi:PKD1 protein, partial [Polypterus senegalus]